ncbi:MAG: hypothetical protein GF401_20590 [Chitinivibrionales bacterium]|nr:hypothetical protein [Chitinivibrionales bacterium]
MKFIAHRGYSSLYPENSIEAFEAVIRHPENNKTLIGFECDIQMTADYRIAIMHNTSIADTSGKKVDIGAISLDHLRTLYRKSVHNPECILPDIHDVLKTVDHRTGICFEIKAGAWEREIFIPLLVEALESYRPAGDVTVSSFSGEILHAAIAATRRLELRYAFIFDRWESWKALSTSVKQALDFIHPHFKFVIQEPHKISACNIPVQCWTVNDPAVVRSIIDMSQKESNIHALMTDDLRLCEQFKDS